MLLTRVLYVKENHGKRFVIVDAGMNDLLRPALYEAYHRIEPVRRARPRRRASSTWSGPVCETGDFLARDRELAAAEPGDLLAVRDAGAYGFSMSSNYNMRPRAGRGPGRGRQARASSAAARPSRTWSGPRSTSSRAASTCAVSRSLMIRP